MTSIIVEAQKDGLATSKTIEATAVENNNPASESNNQRLLVCYWNGLAYSNGATILWPSGSSGTWCKKYTCKDGTWEEHNGLVSCEHG
jgi:hypothetical protein